MWVESWPPREFGQRRTSGNGDVLHPINVFMSANYVLRIPIRASQALCTVRNGTKPALTGGAAQMTRNEQGN